MSSAPGKGGPERHISCTPNRRRASGPQPADAAVPVNTHLKPIIYPADPPRASGPGRGGRLVQGCLHPWAAAPVTGSFGWTVRYQHVGGALQQRAIDPVSGLTGDRRLRILPARFAKAHAARFITFEVVHFPGVLVEPVGLSFAYHDDFIAIPPATRAAHQQSKQGYNS